MRKVYHGCLALSLAIVSTNELVARPAIGQYVYVYARQLMDSSCRYCVSELELEQKRTTIRGKLHTFVVGNRTLVCTPRCVH